MHFKTLASVKKFVRQKRKSIRLTGRTGVAVALGTVGVCVAAAAILVAARQPAQPANVATTNMRTFKAASERTETTPAVRAGAPVETKNMSSKALAPAPAPVTITGCLEHEDGTFRLEKTSGTDAPKSRSWKSGFLKKRSARIDVIDSTNRLQLSNQVGKRVSVVGVLVDREMRARSLQRVNGSCD